jgi:hypothetical protein
VRFHQLLQGSFGFRLLLAFVLEAGKRRQRDNIEAFEVILTCQQACAKMNVARNSALELLTTSGL